MKHWLWFLGGLICGAALIFATHVLPRLHGHSSKPSANPSEVRAHTEEVFTFTANGPMEQVAPLFGANKERVWSPEWDPQFVHPLPADDEEGMVFWVAHEHFNLTWVNTQFDLKNGRVQYVYMIPDALVTVITLRLTPDGTRTKVQVEYDRTAVNKSMDERVKRMAAHDRAAGPDWEKQINAYLATSQKKS